MHLNRLYIKGFRSIREVDLTFTPGKNVVIGRNNAGKSNIIHALNIVLGETAPAYAKSENIEDSDFYTYRISDKDGKKIERSENEIFIWCELQREAAESLEFSEIKKCFGYSFYGKREYRAAGAPYRIALNDLKDEYGAIYAVNEDETPDKVWVDSKLTNQNTFEQQLNDKYQFGYAFLAQRTEKGITKSR